LVERRLGSFADIVTITQASSGAAACLRLAALRGSRASAAKTEVSTTNSSLLRTLAIANHGREGLQKGSVQSLRDIARSEKLPLPEVRALMRLAFLSPVLVQKVLDGRLPPVLN
jgi:hypothetical protein